MRPQLLLPALALGTLLAPDADAAPHDRRPVELTLGLGFGNAVCDDKKPDSDCPVDKAGTAVSLSGAWRFHKHAAVGLELGVWSYRVRDAWKGQLADPATDVKFSSAYFGPYARWYFVARGVTDAYLQAGIAVGNVKGEAKNASGTYDATFTGVAFPVAIGAEWYVAQWFRLGPQLGAYLHRSTQACETVNGTETCSKAARDQALLAWRFLVNLTFTLG